MNVSAEDISNALEGITYPASKKYILEYAGEKDAPAHVVAKLEELDSEYYHSLDEIYNQFGIQTCAKTSYMSGA